MRQEVHCLDSLQQAGQQRSRDGRSDKQIMADTLLQQGGQTEVQTRVCTELC
jgi:hypothetical protein